MASCAARAFGTVAVAIAVSSCGPHRIAASPPPRYVTPPADATGLGWRTLDPSGLPTNDAELHAQLGERRHAVLVRCDGVLGSLEDERRAMGPIGAQLATGLAQGIAAGLAPEQIDPATGRPQQRPLPLPSGLGVAHTVRVQSRIRAIRAGMHTLVAARSSGEILDAIDRSSRARMHVIAVIDVRLFRASVMLESCG